MAAISQWPKQRRGFTLVELLVSLAIIGVLMALLIPAVQYARESARRIECSSNIRQQVLGLQSFHSAMRTFPAGRQLFPGGEYSWCVSALPYLDQEPLAQQYNKSLPWNDVGGNWNVARTVLPIFRCPDSELDFPGDTDYGGIMGSLLAGIQTPGVFDYENGVMIEVGGKNQVPVSLGEIIDGTSQTILVAESSDRPLEQGGLWVSGYNCFSHDNGHINLNPGEIFSWHPGGSFVGLADGSVRFLHKEVAGRVVGSLCTRSGLEVVEDF